MKIPLKLTLPDIQASLRDVQTALRPLELGTIALKGGRVTGAGKPIAPFDYVRKFDLETEIAKLQEQLAPTERRTEMQVIGVSPRFLWREADGAADEKLWDAVVSSKVLSFRTRTDADGAGVTWLSVTRGTGTAIANVNLPLPLAVGLTTNQPVEAAIYVGLDDRAHLYMDTAHSGRVSEIHLRSSHGTQASRTNLANADQIGAIYFEAFSNSFFSTAAMLARVDGAVTAGQRPPSRLEFYTNAANAAQTKQLTIDSAGSPGFFSVTPPARQVSGADLTNNVTVGGSSDVIADFTDLATYSNSAAAIRNDIYQLARKVKQINDGLRAYGLFT